jgi:hypothetical protein
LLSIPTLRKQMDVQTRIRLDWGLTGFSFSVLGDVALFTNDQTNRIKHCEYNYFDPTFELHWQRQAIACVFRTSHI